jgi:hypothetical protein
LLVSFVARHSLERLTPWRIGTTSSAAVNDESGAKPRRGSGSRHLGRPAIGILLLLLYSAATDARWLYQTLRIAHSLPPTDEVTAYERRFRELKTWLPQRGVVGYFDGVESGPYAIDDSKRFFLAQYAVAPTLVVRKRYPTELVIGNLRPGVDSIRIPPELQVVHDFGDGLLLMKHRSR